MAEDFDSGGLSPKSTLLTALLYFLTKNQPCFGFCVTSMVTRGEDKGQTWGQPLGSVKRTVTRGYACSPTPWTGPEMGHRVWGWCMEWIRLLKHWESFLPKECQYEKGQPSPAWCGLSWLPLGVDIKCLIIHRLLREARRWLTSLGMESREKPADLTVYKVAGQAL